MCPFDFSELLAKGDSAVNDSEKGSQSRGGGVKVYPSGEVCTVCGYPLTQLDPRDTCFRCQEKGQMGNPREPIDKNKRDSIISNRKEGEDGNL